MAFLTSGVVLASLCFIAKTPTLIPKIESLPEFETSWNANLDLAVAMSKDTRIAKILDPTNWKKLLETTSYLDICTYLHSPNGTKWKMLKDVSSFLDRNGSQMTPFVVLEEVLRIPSVEDIVKIYPEYELVLVTAKALVISITENIGPQDMTPENWKRLLEITRMDKTSKDNPDCENVTDVISNCTGNCEQQFEEKIKFLEFVNPDITAFFQDLVPNTTQSALGFLQLGHLLKFPLLVKRSQQFLKDELSIENVIGIYQATSTSTEFKHLKEKAEEFIIFEFEEIFKKNKNFISLKVNEMYSVLTSEKINIANEYSVFEAIVRWVQAELTSRKNHVTTLFKSVRLHICSLSHLVLMLHHPLLVGLEPVQQSVRSAIDLIESNSTELAEMVKKEQRHLHETLFVIGGRGTGQSSITVETFSAPTKQWKYHPSLNNATEVYTSAIAVGQTIIVLDHNRYSVSSFDPIKKEWKFLSMMPNELSYSAVAELNGEIFVLGGGTPTAVSTCQRFNHKTGVWNSIPNLNQARSAAAAATMQGKIYVAGGWDSKALSTVEVFDPEKMMWAFISPLNYARRLLALVTEENYLWAFGGDKGGDQNYVEKFDSVIGKWIMMPPMPTARRGMAAVYFYGNFYLMSGYYSKAVEVYNPRRKTWTRSSDMCFQRFFFGACVIKGLPNSYDYL